MNKKTKPKIICFCGSSRFVGQMAILMWKFEKEGNIATVMTVRLLRRKKGMMDL